MFGKRVLGNMLIKLWFPRALSSLARMGFDFLMFDQVNFIPSLLKSKRPQEFIKFLKEWILLVLGVFPPSFFTGSRTWLKLPMTSHGLSAVEWKIDNKSHCTVLIANVVQRSDGTPNLDKRLLGAGIYGDLMTQIR